MSNPPQNPNKKKYLKSFISGGCAGIVAKSVIAPFDRVKILFVTSSRKFTYKAAINEATTLYRTQGLKSLWRGNTATAIRVFPYSAIQFASFDFFQNFFRRPEHTAFQKNLFNFLSGSLTGIVSTIATYPADFVRTRMAIEVEVHAQKSIVHAVKTIYRTEGIGAFYHGLIPSLTGIIPYHGVGFGMYHLLKGNLIENHPQWKQSKAFDFLFGAIAGLGAQLVAYPFDVIRKKMQVQAILVKRGEITQEKYFWNVNDQRLTDFLIRGGLLWVKDTIKTEGVKGMYKGITMNLIKGPISTGTSFMVKNIVNRILDKNYSL